MFNESDDLKNALAACWAPTQAVEAYPADYFAGLPDPTLVIPKNILLFSRQGIFEPELGVEHHHHRLLLIICLRGKGSVIVDHQVADLTPGHALLIMPNQFHHFTHLVDSELLWAFLSFELDEEDIFNLPKGRMLEMSPFQLTCMKQVSENYKLAAESKTIAPTVTILTALLLSSFENATPLDKITDKLPKESSHQLIQEVTSYVNDHITETIHISDVAKYLGFSESHLRSRFQKAAGVGLGAYIRRLRLYRARTLMLTSDLRLQEIAEKCGYDSIYTFSRAFRREIGISPSYYRQRAEVSKKKWGKVKPPPPIKPAT